MRVQGDLPLSPHRRGCASALTWLRPERLLAVVSTGTASASEVVVVNPRTRRVLRRSALPAPPTAVGRATEELILLFSGFGEFAPCTPRSGRFRRNGQAARRRAHPCRDGRTRRAPSTGRGPFSRVWRSIRTASARSSSPRPARLQRSISHARRLVPRARPAVAARSSSPVADARSPKCGGTRSRGALARGRHARRVGDGLFRRGGDERRRAFPPGTGRRAADRHTLVDIAPARPQASGFAVGGGARRRAGRTLGLR